MKIIAIALTLLAFTGLVLAWTIAEQPALRITVWFAAAFAFSVEIYALHKRNQTKKKKRAQKDDYLAQKIQQNTQ